MSSRRWPGWSRPGSPALAPPAARAAVNAEGYWEVASDGGMFAFGDAEFFGSMGGKPLAKPIIAIAATPTGKGYWQVASDGGIFAYGDALFHGSTGAIPLVKPIVGMAATPTGNGYWLVASDGGVFAFGDAGYVGSLGAIPLATSIVGMATTATGNGYWLVAADGGVFAVGDAPHLGSMGGKPLSRSIVGMATLSVATTLPPELVKIVPVATNDTLTTFEDTPATVVVLSNDAGLGDGGIVVTATQPAHGSVAVNLTNTVTYTPDADFNGTDTFDYTVTDTDGDADTATVTVTVTADDDAPVAVDDTATTNEDTAATIGVLPNDTDPDGDALSVALVTQPANGTVVVNADDTVTYTPDAGFNGTDTFGYTVADGNGGTDTGTVTVTVTAVNDALPVAAADADTTDEDTPATVDVLANDTGLADAPVVVTIAAQPTNGTVVVNGDGTVTYTPDADFNGTDTFDYTVTDAEDENDTATVTVTVTAVNDAPVAADDAATTDEDTAAAIGVLTNDTDLEGDTLAVDLVTQPTNGTVVVNGDGTVTYTPDADFNGTDTFDYTVADGNGGVDSGTVTVTVTAVDDAPVAAADAETTNQDVASTVDVLANDTGLGDGSVVVTIAVQPTNGTVVVNGDGTVTYTPDADFNGTDSFDYTVTDGDGDDDTVTVTVTVTPVSDALPAAADDAATTNEDTAATIGVLTNDTGLADAPVVVTIAVQPTDGTVVVNGDGTVTYTPDADFYGIDTFDYTVTDADGDDDTATVTLTVIPVSDGSPLAVPDTVTINVGASVTLAVLDNDAVADGAASVEVTTEPASGTAVVNADGTITYTAPLGVIGVVTFVYRVTDADGQTSSALVTLVIS